MKKEPIVVIINDCQDDNAKNRQTARVQALFKTMPSFIGVGHELEAGGNIIDSMDAIGNEHPGVILSNIAPRNGNHKNGTPFCFFQHNNILVVSTLSSVTFSFVRKMGIKSDIYVIDTEKATEEMASKGYIPSDLIPVLPNSQFRSYDFLPRVGNFIYNENSVTSQLITAGDVRSCPDAIWMKDCFGNCKTTLLQRQGNVKFKEGKTIETAFGSLVCVQKLSDVPEKTAALVLGSSGINNRRLLEVMIRGGNAAEHFNIRAGSPVF